MLRATVQHHTVSGKDRIKVIETSGPEPVIGTITRWRIRMFNSSDHPQKETHQFVKSVLIFILYQSLLMPLPLSFQDLLVEAFQVGDVGFLWRRHLSVHTAWYKPLGFPAPARRRSGWQVGGAGKWRAWPGAQV